jgi:hypothetical protein
MRRNDGRWRRSKKASLGQLDGSGTRRCTRESYGRGQGRGVGADATGHGGGPVVSRVNRQAGPVIATMCR